MGLQELAQIGEFLGGLSVLLTLIYLALQIRGNTKAVHSSAAQLTHDTLTQGYYELARNPQLNKVFRAGTRDLSTLSEDDVGQFFAFWSGTLYMAQNWLYQKNAGTLDDHLWSTFLSGMAANFHSAGFQSYWKERKYTFSHELQEWVEGIIAEPPTRAGHILLGISENP